jgi:hypothetical protein
MTLVPLDLSEANDFVRSFHRHNKPTQGGKFAIGLSSELGLCGVAIVGRPIARLLSDDFTAEVLRLCVHDDAPRNACSKLYAAAWRACKAMGYKKLITYTLQTESGDSLRGAGFKIVAESKNTGKGWTNRPNRNWQPVYGQLKFRWELSA